MANHDVDNDAGFLFGGGKKAQNESPNGLIETIANIEQYAVAEKSGVVVDPHFVTIKDVMDFFMVGLKNTFASTVISLVLIPLSVGVMSKRIAIFGSLDPTLFDKIFSLLLAVSWNLGLALIFAYAASQWVGNLTKKMIKNLLSGMTAGLVLKIVLAFITYNVLYFYVLIDEKLINFIDKIHQMSPALTKFAISFANFLANIRESLPTSVVFVVITSILFIFIPWLVVLYKEYENKKGQDLSSLVK